MPAVDPERLEILLLCISELLLLLLGTGLLLVFIYTMYYLPFKSNTSPSEHRGPVDVEEGAQQPTDGAPIKETPDDNVQAVDARRRIDADHNVDANEVIHGVNNSDAEADSSSRSLTMFTNPHADNQGLHEFLRPVYKVRLRQRKRPSASRLRRASMADRLGGGASSSPRLRR